MMEAKELVKCGNYDVEVVRTSREKTAKVEVDHGVVSIHVPLDLSAARIQEVVEAKQAWIADKIAIHDVANPKMHKEYVSGEAFPYLGRNYRLKVLPGDTNQVKLRHGELRLEIVSSTRYVDKDARARRLVRAWYMQRAQELLTRKVGKVAKEMRVETPKVVARAFKSRWGSCRPDGILEFNWQIVLAPLSILEYVVVHEVAHLIHPNHSKKFWALVSRHCPTYKFCRDWLKENSQILRLD